MKKFILAAAALFAALTTNAKTSGIQDVMPNGGFSLGVMFGVHPASSHDLDWATEDPVTPNFEIDGNWVLSSGFINAGKFGKNGAIDLGFYYGNCYYHNAWDEEIKCQQHVIGVRCAFHFEFVPKLDVYTGMMSGVNILVPYGDDKNGYYQDGGYYVTRETDASYSMGPFIGCKYYFTDCFGVRGEFAADWASDGASGAAIGVTFKF